jgi:hypothetical protein
LTIQVITRKEAKENGRAAKEQFGQSSFKQRTTNKEAKKGGSSNTTRTKENTTKTATTTKEDSYPDERTRKVTKTKTPSISSAKSEIESCRKGMLASILVANVPALSQKNSWRETPKVVD